MSNDPASEPSSPASEPASQGMPPSRIILFSILGILLVALAYDFLVARPGQKAAAERVRALMAGPSDAKMINNAEPITHAQVLETIGVEPSWSEEGPTYYMERFSWRSGLPWRTHDLYVIYTKTDTEKNPRLLHDISIGQPPEPRQFPRPATAGSDATPVAGATTGATQAGAAPDRAAPPARAPGEGRTEATGDGGSKERPAETTTPQPEPAG
jgi:hypothetical protein